MRNDWTPRGLTQESLAIEKEIKVSIPVSFHVKLHTLKVLRGKSISATVRDALSDYFENLQHTNLAASNVDLPPSPASSHALLADLPPVLEAADSAPR